ncbi:MAG: A/G-specific adenine glycosylase [Candidatus Limnocylindrales bacterium]
MPNASSFPTAAGDAILAWYEQHGRALAFRRTTDPYAVLVSEAMAQQTQAARAAEAWVRFMDRFPTVRALAAASTADVLRAWHGLGYNRRAVSLQRAARQIVELHGGRVPDDIRSLEALPGVGSYTARAVAAIAFGRAIGAVDTNVRRVLGRIIVGDAGDIPVAELQRLADGAVPPGRAGDWTHALMDVGATVCGPRRTDCETCPARPWCAFAAGARPRSAVAPTLSRRLLPPAFASTSRWLRGRIVDRLRASPDGVWTDISGPIGEHDEAAVLTALAALAEEGLIELARSSATDGSRRARLPLG